MSKASVMRTTVELRQDLYNAIVRENGKRGISQTINKVLAEHYYGANLEDMFGCDPWLKKVRRDDYRDEDDRDF